MRVSVCVVCLGNAHPKAQSSLAPLLIGELLNNSAVSDVKEIALIPGWQVNVRSFVCCIKRRL